MNWQSSWQQPVNPVDTANVQSTVIPEPAKLDDPISDDMKKRLEVEQLPISPDGILMLWQRTQKILQNAKADELEVRKTAVKVYVPQAVEGTNTVELGEGFKLKAVLKYNYNLDTDNDKIDDALGHIAKLGNEGSFVSDRLVKWTPSFLLTEYRKLQDDAEAGSEFAKTALKIIGEVLTITDAAPTLNIVEPKGKK